MDFLKATQKIVIVGFGVEGKSFYTWLLKHDKSSKEIFIYDEFTTLSLSDLLHGGVQISKEEFLNIAPLTFVFRSPGIHPSQLSHIDQDKIITSTNFLAKYTPTKKIIGVTGTKGKGTTSTLLFELLKTKYKDVLLGGNIGNPVFNFFDELTRESIVVMELSSFQLMDFTQSFHYAILLRTHTEHLNWHKDLDEYHTAKKQLFIRQKPEDVAVVFGEVHECREIIKDTSSQKIWVLPCGLSDTDDKQLSIENEDILLKETNVEKKICSTNDIVLRGQFQRENICSAIAMALEFDISNDNIKKTLQNFYELPMRGQLIAEKNGRKFFNDSFSTIPYTTIVSLSTFSTPVFLILGGGDKNSDFTLLIDQIIQNSSIKKVLLIGTDMAPKLQQFLEKKGFDKYVRCASMEEVFQVFKNASQEGDSLLLSPACTSFDLYKSYKERGDHFNRLVELFDLQ